MNQFELKVGQRYLDRHDNVWLVYKCEPTYRYPFEARPVGKDAEPQSYTREGRWSYHTRMGCDLVKPVEP